MLVVDSLPVDKCTQNTLEFTLPISCISCVPLSIQIRAGVSSEYKFQFGIHVPTRALEACS